MQRPYDSLLYEERLHSNKTQALFLALAALLTGIWAWRARADRRCGQAGLAFGAAFFGFYALNYRTLRIRATRAGLQLRFGIFSWTVPVAAIESCAVDVLPPVQRFGGAGIHFMVVRGRYRVSFNFLEYPRVVVALRSQSGPVRDVSFTTRHPEAVCAALSAALSSGRP